MGLLTWLFGDRKTRRHRVEFDDVRVLFTETSGKTTIVRWDDLQEVGILTTDEGPVADDVFWILVEKSKSGVAVPSESEGAKELLARLQLLPGFDNEAVIRAMGSAENAQFVCWRRDASL